LTINPLLVNLPSVLQKAGEGEMRKQALLTTALTILFASTTLAAEDGKSVFLKYNCNNCHSVSTADITSKNAKSKAPDLVDVTVRHTTESDQKAWLRKFIRETTGHVSCPKVDKARDGKLHSGPKFNGTQDEENALVDWLDQQRSK